MHECRISGASEKSSVLDRLGQKEVTAGIERRWSTYLPELSGRSWSPGSAVSLSREVSWLGQIGPAILMARTAPAFRPSLSGLLTAHFSCRQYCHIFTTVVLAWCHKLKAAVALLLVVPRNKSMHPLTSFFPGG